jgi:serine/threonine protein kinase/tetratricopeptide (TPR) repeat protein
MSWALAAGAVVTHYRVMSLLGAGGMGQVYLAEDARLGRRLALKVLTPRAHHDEAQLRRFEREARTVSALNHPNVLTIYDIGRFGEMPFLATEYIDGVTVRALIAQGPLEPRRALDIAVQVACALEAAHSAGVIHRDLKPENVMVRADGYVKVLDFGLAKLADESPFTNDHAAFSTEAGMVMGTFGYMSPEQLRGDDVDARADLFALGVLLYEMLTGRPPFTGTSAVAVAAAILSNEAPPRVRRPDLPDDVGRIVATALDKDRGHRYQACTSMLRDLRSAIGALPWEDPPSLAIDDLAVIPAVGNDTATVTHADTVLGPPAPTRTSRRRRTRKTIDSLAVLPLVNRGQDEELDYFSDGLTEALINNLSQVPRLRVMARSTVFRYKAQACDPREVGRQLGVRAVLTGHIVERRDTFSVGAELVDTDDGAQLWGAVLSRPRSDVFRLQAEVADELTAALRLRLTRDQRQRLVDPHTASAEAYQLYLRGRYLLNNRTGSALTQARTLFERAVVEDPRYALAHAGLADCCSLLAINYRATSSGALIEQGRAAAMTALRLNESLAAGHASLAFIKFRFDWDWTAAASEFARAIALNPGHAPSRQWHAMYLASRSRFEEGLAEMRRALDLDPLSLIIQTGIGRILHFAKRLDEAVAQYDHVLQINPAFAQTRVDLALTHMALGDLGAARHQLARARDVLGPVSTILLLEGCCDVADGRFDEARQAFTQLETRYAHGEAGADDLALLAAALGEHEAAVHWLAEACRQRSPFLGYVDVEPAMAPLRRHPGCRDILRRYGFDAVADVSH